MVDKLVQVINFRSLLCHSIRSYELLFYFLTKSFFYFKIHILFNCKHKMTSTNFNVGIGDIRRNTSKVLKPPGGGSSDIFGTASCDDINPHKRGTNQKNLQSSIILGGQSPKHSNGTATNGNSDKPAIDNSVEPKIVNENIEDINLSETPSKDGNPVTGEGYEAPKAAATPAQHVSAQSEPAPEQKKASRVPPGGFSSGLW